MTFGGYLQAIGPSTYLLVNNYFFIQLSYFKLASYGSMGSPLVLNLAYQDHIGFVH